VVTGSASEETRAAVFKAGCAGFLAKPVNPVQLLAQVAGLLTHEKTQA
jgi:DNA-binding response OmpR family regulator